MSGPNMSQKLADTLVGTSMGLAGASWVADLEPYITLTAGIVAIVAGVIAGWYHLERAVEARSKRLSRKK